MSSPMIRIERYDKISYIFSLILHGVVAILFLKITATLTVEAPKFYELTLGQVTTQELEQILRTTTERQERMKPSTQGTTPSDRVEIPERKMMEIEEPTLSISNADKISPTPMIISPTERKFFAVEPIQKLNDLPAEVFQNSDKQTFDGTKIDAGVIPGKGIETNEIAKDIAPTFIIEGEVKDRQLLYNPLPEYPEGYNKEATIKIRFTVLADGTVGNMEVLIKADTKLENLTMNVLRLWRFNGLVGTNRQETGIITFQFKLVRD